MSLRVLLCMVMLAGCAFAQSTATAAKTTEQVMALLAHPAGVTPSIPATLRDGRLEYKLLATNRTSTMQKELNEAANAGYRFGGVMGGETAFGGSEVVVIMYRDPARESKEKCEYRLLATSRTSTMQKELQQAGDAGFEYQGQTVFSTTFGGKEVVVILERDPDMKQMPWEYKLLATSRTSTMDKELNDAGNAGYQFVGVTVGDTSVGGKEVVCILRKPRAQ
jgi:hypothetical protein